MGFARYLTYLSTLLIVGALGARAVVTRGRLFAADARDAVVAARLARASRAGAAGLGFAVLGMLVAQTYEWFGAEGLTLANAKTVAFRTAWGQSWQQAAAAAVVAVALFSIAHYWRASRLPIGVGVVVACALAVPLLGHGGSHGVRVYWLHATHLVGSGLWLGTLGVLIWATWPVWRDEASTTATLSGMLKAFTPVALTGALLVAGSGVLIALEHVPSLDALWTTAYGQAFTRKLLFVAAIAILGAINFRTYHGAIAAPDRRRLRRLAVLEATLALVVVLALTAWLTGLPLPH